MSISRKAAAWRIRQAGKPLIALAAVVAIVYWLKFAPARVVRHTVGRGEIVAEVMGTGTLEAHVKANIGPKISGLIIDVLVDQGDHVKCGQILARLDDREMKRQVEAAEAGVAAAEAAVKRQEADRVRAGAVLEQARRYLDRLNTATGGAVSQAERDKATEALGIAEAGVTSADAAVTEARKQLIAAERTLEFQRVRLSDTIITAPYDGLIVRRDRDPGSVVVPGSAILALVSTSEIWISAWVDETEMARLGPGLRARIVFRQEPGRSYTGEVVRLGREVDRETREFLVDVRVGELPANWAVGQRAEVYIETGRKQDAIVLPAHVVVWRDGGAGTFVDENGRAAWRPLSLGLQGRDLVEVINGLSQGEQVILPATPGATLRPGQRVTAVPHARQEPTENRA